MSTESHHPQQPSLRQLWMTSLNTMKPDCGSWHLKTFFARDHDSYEPNHVCQSPVVPLPSVRQTTSSAYVEVGRRSSRRKRRALIVGLLAIFLAE